MSEYTPSTAEVLEAYVRFRDWEAGSVAAFDRWLASERARVWDEGRAAGFDCGRWGGLPLLNPYRGDAS